MRIKNLALLLPTILFTHGFTQMTALPMKITVQAGDTTEFPIAIKKWDKTATNINVNLTQPGHGRLSIIPNFYRTEAAGMYIASIRTGVKEYRLRLLFVK